MSYDAAYRKEQYREASVCLLFLGGVLCAITTVNFVVASQSNLGLLAYPTYSLPVLVAVQGGWGFVICIAGAYTLMYKQYMSTAQSGCCAETPGALCARVCCNPFAKPNTNSVAYYTMPLRWVMYNLYLSIAMALVGILSLLFAPTRASEELLWRWNLLFRSQEGYAILLQNQDEYKCCGFADDFDNAAQPCMMNESGERLTVAAGLVEAPKAWCKDSAVDNLLSS